MAAGGLRESEGMDVYDESEVETTPFEPLTVVLWLRA